MVETSEFESICPYNDEEAVAALNKVANHPAVLAISEYLFPDQPVTYLRNALKSVQSVDEFQEVVMNDAVTWCIDHTVHNFSYDGISYIKGIKGKFLAMSNHRDIILDPAITQLVFYRNGIPMTEICVGDNLIKQSKTVEYLLRSNRMIKVIRGISARDLYLSSQMLSRYIRQTITSGKASIWLAQRQGRTKDGIDTTEQGLLKMLDMSGEKSFQENFMELNIVPLSISYEYEPCDIRKAREILISRTRKYVKSHHEDMHSIVMGIRQKKGNVHLNFGLPLTYDEIEVASKCDKNDRYQAIRHAVDKRVIAGYHLWKTNYIAYDLVGGGNKYSDLYGPEDVESFKAYMEHRLDKVEKRLDRDELRNIFLHIYSNPVLSKERLASG
ncbi:MAG: hypothetical protein J6N46_01365, partial [Bacteroidales bacterium]|nr:hypothetical protein [Bacteroidales bacterium]